MIIVKRLYINIDIKVFNIERELRFQLEIATDYLEKKLNVHFRFVELKENFQITFTTHHNICPLLRMDNILIPTAT